MTKRERYQLPFDAIFGSQPDPAPLFYEIGVVGSEQPASSGLFVRAVREDVMVRSPVDAVHHLLTHIYTPIETFDQEDLWCLLFNSKNRITHEVMAYRGTVNSINIRTAELFKEAVRVNAPALLLSHVHPSGRFEPSLEDVQVTAVVYQGIQLSGIEVLDHIIVAQGGWGSLKEKGLCFTSRCRFSSRSHKKAKFIVTVAYQDTLLSLASPKFLTFYCRQQSAPPVPGYALL